MDEREAAELVSIEGRLIWSAAVAAATGFGIDVGPRRRSTTFELSRKTRAYEAMSCLRPSSG